MDAPDMRDEVRAAYERIPRPDLLLEFNSYYSSMNDAEKELFKERLAADKGKKEAFLAFKAFLRAGGQEAALAESKVLLRQA